MAWFEKPGGRVGRLNPMRSGYFRHGELISILGTEPVFLPLRNDDVVVCRKDYEDSTLGRNDLASTLLNKAIHGPALVAEPQELEP